MSKATRADTQSPPLQVADSHDLIRVHGARENNLKDVSVEIPKRRLTVFTGVSGSGKSSLVFGTIAAESQRLINETYSAFVQGFMPALARPEVDVLEGVTTAIVVDQQRMGADPRSTVGTATDTNAMLRILFSRLGQPHIGPPNAYSFNVASVRASGAITIERGAGKTVRATFSRLGGMCPRCEGRGTVSDINLSQLFDDSKSLNEGAIAIPGYTVNDVFRVRPYIESGILDPDKPIRKYTKKELHDFLHHEPTRMKVNGVNVTYEGLIPKVQNSILSKDPEALQPHVRAFVDRAVTFTTCPECGGTRLGEAARSSRIGGINIADACAMQISDLAEWVRGVDEPSVAPLLAKLQNTLDSFVEIGLGYLSLDRPSGTLSGGEAQRVKILHLGSSLTDVTYVFDEPTTGLHPHDIQRMNDLLLRLRDKGNCRHRRPAGCGRWHRAPPARPTLSAPRASRRPGRSGAAPSACRWSAARRRCPRTPPRPRRCRGRGRDRRRGRRWRSSPARAPRRAPLDHPGAVAGRAGAFGVGAEQGGLHAVGLRERLADRLQQAGVGRRIAPPRATDRGLVDRHHSVPPRHRTADQ